MAVVVIEMLVSMILARQGNREIEIRHEELEEPFSSFCAPVSSCLFTGPASPLICDLS